MFSVKSATLHSVKWTAFGNFSNTAIGFVLGIILARLLTPSDYGTVGMVSIFFAIAGTFTDCGFGAALIRKKEVTEEDKSTMFFFSMGMAFLSFVILFFISPLIAHFFNMPILKNIVRVTAASTFIGTSASIHGNMFSRNLNFRTPAIASIVTYIIGGIVGIVLAYKGYGPWALVWQGSVSMVLKSFIYWILSRWVPKLTFSKKSFKEMFSFGGNLTINSILDIFLDNGRSLVIGKFYSPAQLGLYSKGSSTADMPTSFLTKILNSVLYPVMSKIQDDDQRLVAVYSKYMQILSMIIFFCMMLMIALGRPFIEVLYSSKWLPAAIFLQISALQCMLHHVHLVNWELLLVKGRSDLALKKELVNKVTKFALLIAAIPISVEAICWAGVIGSVCDIFVNTYVTGKVINYGFLKQTRDFVPYLIKAVIFCIPAFAITLTGWHPVIVLLLGGIVSTTLYITFLKITHDENFKELLSVVPLRKLNNLK